VFSAEPHQPQASIGEDHRIVRIKGQRSLRMQEAKAVVVWIAWGRACPSPRTTPCDEGVRLRKPRIGLSGPDGKVQRLSESFWRSRMGKRQRPEVKIVGCEILGT
jgi:hypothetical protein